MTKNFFRRNEKKYLLGQDEYSVVRQEIERHMLRDNYFHSPIYNVYFDTPTNDLVIASLEQPDYKYKIRARTYGDTSAGKVFLEIKSKLDGVVYKRRAELSVEEYAKYLSSGVYKDSQVMRELAYLFTEKQLEPKLFIAYERRAYAATDDSDLRVTFDAKLRSRTHDVAIDKLDGCTDYFPDDTRIMEVKTRYGMPPWLVDLLSTNELYPTSFSKYGQIYQKNNKREVEYA